MSTAPHVTKTTECGCCGHSKDSHCESGVPHAMPDDPEAWFSCITEHCRSGIYENGNATWCTCAGFENPFTHRIAVWRPPTTEETPCATCQHPRAHHCTKSRDRVGLWIDGRYRGCRHVLAGKTACDSTCCNEVVDAAQRVFCRCNKFVSPYSRRKKRGKAMPLFEAQLRPEYQPRPPEKTKAEILIECYRDFPGISCAELAEGAGRSVSWVRRTLRAAGITLPKATRQKAGKP